MSNGNPGALPRAGLLMPFRQSGYGAFSVSQSGVAEVVKYIQEQQEHHRRKTFQEEYREFLRRYEVAYDERYLWD